MSISRHSKIYWLDIRVKGKRIRRSLKTENRNEALARYAPLRDKLLEKHLGEKVRFSDFCKQYLDWAWSSKPASAPREQQRLRKIQDFFQNLEIVYLNEITLYHIEQLREKLQGNGLSKATINRYLQILRGLFYKAIDWEVYDGKNPLKKVRFYREDSPKSALTQTQLDRVIQTAKKISSKPLSPLQTIFHDVVLLAVNTGMRKSEILNLRWESIKEDKIIIKGKADKTRTVPLNNIALEVINKQPRREIFVFNIPNRHQHDLLRRTIIQVRKRTGIDFNFHLLRHTFASMLIEKGVDFITVSRILGHSKLMTSLIYLHTDTARMKKAVDLLPKK